MSHYVSRATGGPKQAAHRLGASRQAAARLLQVITDAQTRGARAALRTLNLERLAGRPIDEIFLGMTDFICREGGAIDDGIARDAFIETIADLATLGVTDLDHLTTDQIQAVFELFATHAIESRICNDIGANVVTLPSSPGAAQQVQRQLHDFIRRGVSDALVAARAALEALTPERVLTFVVGVYESAFGILQALADSEAGK